jgi:hypothetical protein
MPDMVSCTLVSMMLNSTSPNPTPIRTVEEQIKLLRLRRSVVDRLIGALQGYQRLVPQRSSKIA